MITGILNRRAATRPPTDRFWYTPVPYDPSKMPPITPETALALPAVYGCVRVLAETLAMLPLPTYRRLPDGGRDRNRSHPNYRLLQHRPNRWQTRMEWVEMMAGHVALRGNAYSQIVTDPQTGNAVELVPLHPNRVDIEVIDGGPMDGEPLYLVRDWRTQDVRRFLPFEILHIRGMSSGGYKGMSPIEVARRSLEATQGAEMFGTSLWQNKAMPGGVLKHPGKVSENALKNLRESIREIYSGPDGWHNAMILEEGMEWSQVAVTPDDAQWIDSRKFGVIEICRIFRVPPHMVQDLERATFSNVEHQDIGFAKYTMGPEARRVESAINRVLFDDPESDWCEFMLDGLYRGDLASRTAANVQQFMHGALTVDEWRAMENRNPLPDGLGRRHYVPVNLTPVDEVPPSDPRPDPAGAEDDGPDDRESMHEMADRITYLEESQVAARASKAVNPGLWRAWLNRFTESHQQQVARMFRGFGESAADLATVVTAPLFLMLEGCIDGLEPLDSWNWETRREQIAAAILAHLERVRPC